MTKRRPEQDLIAEFIAHLRNDPDQRLCIDHLHNSDCRSRTYADVEFESKSGLHWVVEAKSNDSGDKYNTVHKIFGELLKETGRANRADCRYAILIPEGAVNFYSRAFQNIAKEKFLEFGKLMPMAAVFTSGQAGVKQLTWVALYDAYQARTTHL